jgi:A/G-specific adenine glycosylase
MSKIVSSEHLQFQAYVLRWYHRHGRHELPWRQTTNPYHILVSELMLQQTQVERVIPKYLAFLSEFPSVESLAQASLGSVLTSWQGLGYNRRAKYLQNTARAVVEQHGGVFPRQLAPLLELPGVGPYTAAAIRTFAYNEPEPLIETNVRTIFLHHFFPGREQVLDAELLPLITTSLYQPNPREWYAALMDYGSVLKKLLPNPSRHSKHHQKQSKFVGSLRQVRGEVLRLLISGPASQSSLQGALQSNKIHLPVALQQLLDENLIYKTGKTYALPNSTFSAILTPCEKNPIE